MPSPFPPPEPSTRHDGLPPPAPPARRHRLGLVAASVVALAGMVGLVAAVIALTDDDASDVTAARTATTAIAPATSAATTTTTAPATTTTVATTVPAPTTTTATTTTTTSTTTVPTPATGGPPTSAPPVSAPPVTTPPVTDEAVTEAQAAVDALAAGDWAAARRLSPTDHRSAAVLQQAYGAVTDAKLIPAKVTRRTDGRVDLRLGLVAHESHPTGPETAIMCVHWIADPTTKTVEHVSSVRLRLEPGLVDPATVADELRDRCAVIALR